MEEDKAADAAAWVTGSAEISSSASAQMKSSEEEESTVADVLGIKTQSSSVQKRGRIAQAPSIREVRAMGYEGRSAEGQASLPSGPLAHGYELGHRPATARDERDGPLEIPFGYDGVKFPSELDLSSLRRRHARVEDKAETGSPDIVNRSTSSVQVQKRVTQARCCGEGRATWEPQPLVTEGVAAPAVLGVEGKGKDWHASEPQPLVTEGITAPPLRVRDGVTAPSWGGSRRAPRDRARDIKEPQSRGRIAAPAVLGVEGKGKDWHASEPQPLVAEGIAAPAVLGIEGKGKDRRVSEPQPLEMPLEENKDPGGLVCLEPSRVPAQDPGVCLEPAPSSWRPWTNSNKYTRVPIVIGVFAYAITMLDEPGKPLFFIQYQSVSLLINVLFSMSVIVMSPSLLCIFPSLLWLLSTLAHHKLYPGIGMLIDHLSTHVAAAILGYELSRRRTLLSNKEVVKLPLLNDLIYFKLMLSFFIAGAFCCLGWVLIHMDDYTPMEVGLYCLMPLIVFLLFSILYMATILGKAFIGEVGLVFLIYYLLFMFMMYVVMDASVGDIVGLVTISVGSLTLSGLLGYSTYAYKNLDKVKPFYFTTDAT